jgi:hypothetical protein
MNANQPAIKGGAVTPSDATVLDFSAIYVGGAGNVAVRLKSDGTVLTFTAPPVGSTILIAGDRVMAATTATLLVWLSW